MELLLYNVVDARALDDRIESVHFLRGKGTAANRICPAERLIFASAQRIEVQKLIADPGRARGKIAGDGVQILCVCRIAGDKRRAHKDVRTAVAEQLKIAEDRRVINAKHGSMPDRVEKLDIDQEMVCDRHQTADGFLRGIEARFDGGVDAGLFAQGKHLAGKLRLGERFSTRECHAALRAEEHTVAQQKSSGLFGGDLFAAQLHRGCGAGRDARAACIAAGAVNDRAGLHGDRVFFAGLRAAAALQALALPVPQLHLAAQPLRILTPRAAQRAALQK